MAAEGPVIHLFSFFDGMFPNFYKKGHTWYAYTKVTNTLGFRLFHTEYLACGCQSQKFNRQRRARGLDFCLFNANHCFSLVKPLFLFENHCFTKENPCFCLKICVLHNKTIDFQRRARGLDRHKSPTKTKKIKMILKNRRKNKQKHRKI